MIRKIFLFLIMLSLSAGIVSAVGGGGGGGGGGGDGAFFTNLRCLDTGKISFNQNPPIKPVVVEKADGTNITVPGKWIGTSFESEEAEITEAGAYTVRDRRSGDRTVQCPGLKFSCKLIALSIQECTSSEEGIRARFTLGGMGATTNELQIQFRQPRGPNIRWRVNSRSPGLENLALTQTSTDTYEINAPGAPIVSKIEISYDGCVGRYYRYSQMDCVEVEAPAPEEVPGEKLKCGGYLDIADRVRCRLSLRSDQADEYENFYPEECKSREDKERCLEVYRGVQECWDFPNGPARIACVKRILKFDDIRAEKANCNALEVGLRENCNSELKNKVYDLIKFRLYNLEEEAEEFMEQGRLEEQDVVDFVVNMEQSKLAFNTAQSKEERKSIILQARQYWIALMKKLKVAG